MVLSAFWLGMLIGMLVVGVPLHRLLNRSIRLTDEAIIAAQEAQATARTALGVEPDPEPPDNVLPLKRPSSSGPHRPWPRT